MPSDVARFVAGCRASRKNGLRSQPIHDMFTSAVDPKLAPKGAGSNAREGILPMQSTKNAVFDCLNPDCWCLGGQAELPDVLDENDVAGAQTDWPICDACLEPLSLVELATPNETMLRALAEEAFEHADVPALILLRAICAEMIQEQESAGAGGITSTQAQEPAPSLPRPEDSTPSDGRGRGLSRFGLSLLSGFSSVVFYIPNSW